jgi:hypothetical protein
MDKKTQKKRSKNFSKKYDYYGETPVKVRVDNTPIKIITSDWGYIGYYTATPILDEKYYRRMNRRYFIYLVIISVIVAILLGLLLNKLF